MKKIIIITLLAVSFLAGYYLGRTPNSPDICAWIQKTYEQANRAGDKLSLLDGTAKRIATSRQPEEVYVNIGGKTYRVGDQSQ